MAHVQQQILEGLRDALAAALTSADGRVFLDRIDPLERTELPALLVQESPEGEAIASQLVNGLEERSLSITVNCVVAHSSEYAARVRALGAEVEAVLSSRDFAVPKHGRCQLGGSRIVLDGEGDRALAAREQLWRIKYYTRRGAPDIAL